MPMKQAFYIVDGTLMAVDKLDHEFRHAPITPAP
jgi:hypothetical protein